MTLLRAKSCDSDTPVGAGVYAGCTGSSSIAGEPAATVGCSASQPPVSPPADRRMSGRIVRVRLMLPDSAKAVPSRGNNLIGVLLYYESFVVAHT